MSKEIIRKILFFAVLAVLMLGTCFSYAEEQANTDLSKDGYTLEQVVVLVNCVASP